MGERTVGSFIYQDWPETDPEELAAFYREPLQRQEENRIYRREVLDMAFEAVDPKALAEIRASSRQRGLYEAETKKFLEGGEQAGRVSLTEGAFEGKKLASVLQGFRTISKKEEYKETLQVIGTDEGVYLVNLTVS